MVDTVEVGLEELRNKVAVALMGVSDEDIITEFQHLCFDDGKIIATDTNKFTVRCDLPFSFNDVAVKGEGLYKFLQLLDGDSCFLEVVDSELVVAQATAEQRLGFISVKDFIDPVEDEYVIHDIPITDRLLHGLSSCLKCIETDAIETYRAGITVDLQEGILRLYSTNNESILEFDIGTSPSKDFREIIPAKFARALVVAGEKLGVSGTLEFGENHIAARLKECLILSPFNSGADVDFRDVLDGSVSEYTDRLSAVSDNMFACFKRQLVCGVEEVTTIQNEQDGLQLQTTSAIATVTESLDTLRMVGKKPVRLKVRHLLKYESLVEKISFEEGGIIFHGSGLRYLVAYE